MVIRSIRARCALYIQVIAFLVLSSGAMAQTEWYTPFPYTIQKKVVADSAAVVSAHPLATKVGLDVLRQGGNAIDAAVAVQFALAVVYPQAGNIGGGGFLLYRSASGETAALDYREKAPAAAQETMFQDSLGNVLPDKSRLGIFACGVPGTVDGMWEAHQKYGRLPWYSLLEPAISLAEKGYQITAQEADNLNKQKINFIRQSSLLPAFVRMQEWEEGDWLIQKELGRTLRRISSEGRNGFYTRSVASLIVYEMEKRNGLMTMEDLAQYRSVWRQPLEFDWNGLHVIGMPPPSSGGILVQQMLGMLEGRLPADAGFHSAASIHLMTEVERRAYADRSMHMADSDFWPVPVEQLVAPEYLRKRMAGFDPDKATPSKDVPAGTFKESEETTHYNIVDREGNAVSVTTTLNDSYGSRVVIPGAGFILNNEMDDFSAKPGAPNLYGAVGGKANAVAPGKRPLSSMTPTIITRDNQLVLLLGTPGGTTIPTSVFQVILNIFIFKMSLEDAVQTGRFHHQWAPDVIKYEEGALEEPVIERLRAMGHQLEPRDPIGRVEAILRGPDGKWQVVADRRGDDSAGGF